MKMKKLLLYLFTAAFLMAFTVSTYAQQKGATLKVTNDKELVKAMDNPTVKTIELAQGYYAFLNFTAPEGGSTLLINNGFISDNKGPGGAADCEVSSTASNYCFGAGPTATGNASANLIGAYPDPCTYLPDEGTWSTIASQNPSGNVATFANPSGAGSNVTTFTVPSPGIYTLAYTWPNGDYQAVNLWRFYSKPTVSLTCNTSACGTTQTFNYSYNMGSYPQSGYTERWFIDGSPATASELLNLPNLTSFGNGASGSGSFDYTFASCGSHNIKLEIYHGTALCGSVDMTATTYLYDAPVVTLGSNPDVCGLSTTLSASATSTCNTAGSLVEYWSYDLGAGTVTTTSNSVTVPSCGSYSFTYYAYNGLTGCTDSETATIYFYDTPSVSAGSDNNTCGLTYTLLPSSSASCLNGGTLGKTWSQTAGPGTSTFVGDDVTVSVCGSYTFLYTVTNGPCTATSSVNIYFYDTPAVSAGSDNNTCGLTYTLLPTATASCSNAGTLGKTWSQTAGPGTSGFVGDVVTVSACGQYTFLYTVTNGPCTATASVNINFYDTPIVDAGSANNTCGLTYTLLPSASASCLNGGSLDKTWSQIAGPGTSGFVGDDVTVTACGQYTFLYTVTNGPCTATASVNIDFYDTPSVSAGSQENVCGLTYTLLPSASASCLNGGILGKTWSKTDGPGTVTFTGDVVEVSSCGIYTFLYTVTNGPCTATASVNIYFFDTPIISAGSNNNTCGLTYTLTPSASASCLNGGALNKTWSKIVGPGTATFVGDVVTVSQCGSYTFLYTVTNVPCTATASVNIDFYDTPTVSAGTAASVCGLNYLLTPSASTNCFTPSNTWSQTGGPGTSTFSGNNVEVSECGEYTFMYTSVNGPCTATASVNIKFFSSPVPSVTGVPDVCGLTTALDAAYTLNCASLGSPSTAWSQTAGPGTSTFTGTGTIGDPYTVTVSQCGSYTFAYEVTNAPCAPVSASVTVKFFDTPTGHDAGATQDVCGLAATFSPTLGSVSCDHGTAITGVYTLKTGPGTASITGNAVEVSTCGTYTFKYRVTNGPCYADDDVVIKFYDTPTGTDAGPAQNVCGLTASLSPTLGTVSCANGGTVTGAWSMVPGPAGSATFTGNSVTVSECGEYTFRYTTTNGPCSAYDDVTIKFFATPVIGFDAEPSIVCGYNATVYAAYTLSCSSLGTQTSDWTYTGPLGATATVTLNTGTLYDIVVSECGDYTFTYTVVNGPCTATESFTTTFNETPNPSITGSLDVFACSEVTYTVADNRTCTGGNTLSYSWEVTGGTYVSAGPTSITVTWSNSLTAGTVSVTASIVGLPSCKASTNVSVTKKTPTLSGQVKYWNAFETYMPTPYPTDFYGTFPEDYFYVTLYKVGSPDVELATKLVEPRLNEDLVELLSSFEYDLPVSSDGCAAQYYLKVWDGGLVYHSLFGGPTPPTVSDTYLGGNYTYTNWGGGNATDALAIQLMVGNATDINAAPYNYAWVGTNTALPTAYGYYSKSIANVNISANGITALDALTLNYRSVGLIGSFPSAVSGVQYSPNFKVTGRMVPSLPYTTFPAPFYSTNVDDIQFNHSGNSYLYFTPAINHKYTSANLPWDAANNYINIYYTATGDINSSYVPTSGGFKAEPAMSLSLEGKQAVALGEVVTIPVRVDRSAEIGAISLGLNYRKDLVEVIGTNFAADYVNVNAEKANINIGWFNTNAMNVNADDAIAFITVRVLANIEEGTRLFELTSNTELADASANVIEGVNLKSTAIYSAKASSTELTATNYPNPFNANTTISYNLPEAGKVTVIVYNKLGQAIRTLVNGAQDAGVQTIELSNANLLPGVYQYRITLNGKNGDYSVVKSMIVVE